MRLANITIEVLNKLNIYADAFNHIRDVLNERERRLFLAETAVQFGYGCKGNRLEAYRFIDEHHKEFGIRWLLRRLGICPNACYNYRKHRKADYCAQKAEV